MPARRRDGHARARRGGHGRARSCWSPAPAGTTVEAQDLFFNTPGAAQVPQERAGRAGGGPAAAARPSRSRIRRCTSASPTTASAVLDGAARARPCATGSAPSGASSAPGACSTSLRKEGAVRGVRASIAPPQLARGNRDEITLIVNGRPVRDTALAQAPDRGLPAAPVARPVPGGGAPHRAAAAEVDVNVHPTKAWVRFRAPRLVQEVVFRAVQDALRSVQRASSPSAGSGRRAEPQAERAGTVDRGLAARWPGAPADGGCARRTAFGANAPQAALFREATAAFGAGRFGAVIGQLQDTFIVSASDDEVFFIDQHVAHERVLFERLRRDLDAGPLAVAGAAVPAAARARARAGRAPRASGRRPRGPGLRPRGVRRLHRGAARGARAAQGRGAAAAHRGARSTSGWPRQGEPAPLAPSRALLRRLPRRHQGPRAARSARRWRGSSRTSRHTETPYFCPHGRPIVSRLSLTGDQARARADMVSRAAAARHGRARPGSARPRSRCASPG